MVRSLDRLVIEIEMREHVPEAVLARGCSFLRVSTYS